MRTHALARKANQFIQSHQASSLDLLYGDPHLQFSPSVQPNLDPAETATRLHPIPQPPAVPAPQLPLTAIRGLRPPSPPPAGSTGHTVLLRSLIFYMFTCVDNQPLKQRLKQKRRIILTNLQIIFSFAKL